MKKTLIATIAVLALLLGACSKPTSIDASCSVAQSDNGQFGSDSERADSIKAEHDLKEWVALEADGNWSIAWERATEALGDSLHIDIAWLEVEGEVTDLYGKGETLNFSTPLIVSRTRGGLVNDVEKPALFIEVKNSGEKPNYGSAKCSITQIRVGNSTNSNLLELLQN